MKPFTRAETGAPPAGGHAGVSNNGSDTAGARNWHALAVDDVFIALNTSRKGLSETDAAERAARYGLNQLPPPQIRSGWQRLLAQFHNVLIYVLLSAGLVTLSLGHWIDSGVIFAVVIINALIGFAQEGKAEKALDAVKKMLSPQAIVSRDARRLTVAAETLVPGDLVHLQSGDRVPADLRLIGARNLHIDEAILTGESVPASKSIEAAAEEAQLADRGSMAYSGTFVTSGQGAGVVVETGKRSEIGRISQLLARVQPLTTPLIRKLSVFSRWLTGAILALASLTFLFGTMVRSYPASEMFLAAVGLAVAAIPEGLPAIITITLAVGVQRMARANAIIRRLPAVETLGSVTVICSDKTGTLTRNEMTLQSVVLKGGTISVSGVGYEPHGGFSRNGDDLESDEESALEQLLRAGMLCNDSSVRKKDDGWSVHGDPTEGALLVAGMKAGLQGDFICEQFPRTDIIPFESEHRFMATLHHDHEGNSFVYIKGAPEALLPRCSRERQSQGSAPFDPDYWQEKLEELTGMGQRPLAIATKSLSPGSQAMTFEDVEADLELLGLVGIIDPPRDEAIRAVERCCHAGIRVKMITGDHIGTARAIAKRMGIGNGSRACNGEELSRLDAGAFADAARDIDVFARTSPEHKLKLVKALQEQNEVVAMTGDGVNDAPALKRADVGVAMGIKGTEAAKEAAEMVLADDNFASIARAVEEGRTVFDNIKKAMLFILPTNGGEAMIIMAAVLLGRVLPVTAPQILWVNMVTAVTLALALAFEPAETDVMGRPPRKPAEPILTAFMWWRISMVSIVMVAVTFGLFIWEREHGASIESARTVAVNALVVLEIFYLFTTRHLKTGVLNREGLLGNRYVLISIAAVVLLQVIYTYAPPMQTFFRSESIGIESWIRIILLSSLVLFIVELDKYSYRRRQRQRSG
ncbi:MAG: cation-transporting P-type ATPase [Gammaproteobacteria bacterium]|nr:cation-transporting P-type ATPase [Gammaproteobacteria bacterium]